MHNGVYYREKLSANKLLKCYELAPCRIKQYLNAEIEFVISNMHPESLVLELGCGYGRVIKEMSAYASCVVGNDTSKQSLEITKSYMVGCQNYAVFLMDASLMAFRSDIFDTVFCIQNGISAFGVDKKLLVAESIRVTKNRGTILFSSYASKIWQDRLEWFRKQAESDLIGEIDEEKTCNGTIVCKDGFRSTTIGSREFIKLFNGFGLKPSIVEVDESSIFCRVIKQ